MDHLPLPLSPAQKPIEVPYRCTEPYDNGPMRSYPDRHGWQVLYAPSGIFYLVDDKEPSDSKLEAFLQNWLYFGLLHEAFGEFSSQLQFVKNNAHGEPIINTQHLGKSLSQWVDKVNCLGVGRDIRDVYEYMQMNKLIFHVWKVALNSKSRTGEHAAEALDARIWLSIAALAETIENLMLDLCTDLNKDLPLTVEWRTPKNPSIGKFVLDAMLDRGWCPFDVERIDLTTKSAGLSLLLW